MTDLATISDDMLKAAHALLDAGDPANPAQVQAHHEVTTEMLVRGIPHGHVDDPWATAVLSVDEVSVDGPDEIEAPEGMAKAWDATLADGGTITTMLTVDGWVLKADPGPSAVHVNSIMGSQCSWDDEDHLAGLTDDDKAWFGVVAVVLDGGGDPDEAVEKAGNPEPLRDYWRKGGNGKINWGAGGDFTACATAVSKYMTSEQAKGYCAIRHRETTGMWPGDKRNRAQKATDALTDPFSRLVLPDGAVYEVEKRTYSRDNIGRFASGGGGASLPKSDRKAVKGSLARGSQVESYGYAYQEGQRARSHPDAEGKIAERVKRRDAALEHFRSTAGDNNVSGRRSSAAFAVADHQGFIDGATGAKPWMARSHSLGETLAGFAFGGLSGATKARDVEKRNYTRDNIGRFATTGGSGGSHPPRGSKEGKPDQVHIRAGGKDFALRKGADSVWDHIEHDGAGGFRLSDERQRMHAEIVGDLVRGKPAQEHPTFTMLGGGGGSGKSTLGRTGLFPDEEIAVKIDPDEMKVQLAKRDPALQAMSKDARAGASHEESSMLAASAQAAGFAQRSHVILDGTGDNGADAVLSKVLKARDAGYEVNGVYASVPTQLAWARNVYRGQHNPDRGIVGAEHLVKAHQSVSSITPEIAPHFDRFTLFDTTRGQQEGPRAIASAKRGEKIQVDDEAFYSKFRRKSSTWGVKELEALKIPKAYLESGPPPDEGLLPGLYFE